MAKFRTIVQEVEAEQWTVKSKPERVTQKAGIQELGFVDGSKGRKDCKIGDYIISEVGGAYPMSESEFVSRFEEVQETAPVQSPPQTDTPPQTDAPPVTEENTTEATNGEQVQG
jgi:hypothetical protein